MPIVLDQMLNAYDTERKGVGIAIPYKDLTSDNLKKSIDEMLTNPKYAVNAKKLSSILNDQLTKPLDRAVWWF